MPQGYYRNVDDSTSDPELIAGRYQVGRNIFFEVALTLSEYADNIKSAGGGSASQTPTYIETIGYEGDNTGGCPEERMFVWVGDPGDKRPRSVRAKSLLKGTWHLYNPLTRNFNLLTAVELIENVPLLRQTTGRGVSLVNSETHKNIRNTSDFTGIKVTSMPLKSETLVVEKTLMEKQNQYHLYQDFLSDLNEAKRGNVVKVTLDAEFIYAAGEEEGRAVLSHNRKMIGELNTI